MFFSKLENELPDFGKSKKSSCNVFYNKKGSIFFNTRIFDNLPNGVISIPEDAKPRIDVHL